MAAFSRRIHSRGYELDARFRIPPGVIARYCEHVRWAALLDAQSGLTALLSGGRRLVVRAQDLSFYATLAHEEELEISVSLPRVGRSSLTLAHDLVRVRDGFVVARSLMTGVSLDATGKPTPVPAELAASVTGQSEASPAIPSEPSEGVWSMPWQVRASDLDPLGHVNQSRYVELVDDVREAAVRAGAYGEDDALRGTAKRIVVDYRRETKLGTALTVRTWRAEARVLGFTVVEAATGVQVTSARLEL